MTQNLKQNFLRGIAIAAVVGGAMVATPGTAQAAFISFTVVEGAVPGTSVNTFTADKLNGGYVATLTQTPGAPCAFIQCGTFTETASATFAQYFLGALVPATQYIGDAEPNGYSILGTLNSSGTYVRDTCGFFLCDIFTFVAQTGTLTIDADGNGVGEIALLSASGVGAGSNGTLLYIGGPTGATGSFNSNFTSSTVAPGVGSAYWPTLAGLSFLTTINGDVDALDSTIRGDVSVQFSPAATVPEPATLGMLGFGLVAAARRRLRAKNAK